MQLNGGVFWPTNTSRPTSTQNWTPSLLPTRKNWPTKRKKGKVDEREADAISSTLFTMLMKWVVQEGNVFVWVYALLMRHLTARSINIDSVAIHSTKKGILDFITF
jgi:hypothetical protein